MVVLFRPKAAGKEYVDYNADSKKCLLMVYVVSDTPKYLRH